jgi:hypothetical protein
MHGLSPQMKNFIDCVADPMMNNETAFIPDQACERSICLRDSIQVPVLTNGNTTDQVYGVVLGLQYGKTGFSDNSLEYTTMPYSFWVGYVNSAGELAGIDVSPFTMHQYVGVNQAQITGGTTAYDNKTSLVQSLRMISAGLRVLPIVETVTDQTQLHVSYYIGAQVSPNELQRGMNNSTSVEDIFRSAPSSMVYGNNDGCTVRYNPFQSHQQLWMRELDNLVNVSEQVTNFDYIRMPCILVMFSQPVSVGNQFPIRTSVQYWLEGELNQPTAIFCQSNLADPEFDRVRLAIANDSGNFPYTTSGHSFTAVGAASLVLQALERLAIPLISSYVRGKKKKKKRKDLALGTKPATGPQSYSAPNTGLPQKPPRRRVRRRARRAQPVQPAVRRRR